MKNNFKGMMNFISLFQLGSAKIKILSTLFQNPMSIKQIQQKTRMSERSVRMHVKELLKKGFIERKAVGRDRLMYMYYAPGNTERLTMLFRKMLKEIESVSTFRKRELVKWSKIP